jgi:hypothetical protein
VTYRLAPMSPSILTLTLIVLALPPVFLVIAVFWTALLVRPALFLVALYAWIWLRARPTAFVVHPRTLEVIWPFRRREIRREDITAVRLIDAQSLRREVGGCVRVGVGGLWGGFGWLWTVRRGIVQMYVSRTDGLVWIERGAERPWLITPDRPAAFVEALSTPGSPVPS